MLKPDFLFKQTVTIRRWLRRGVSGNEYADPEQIKCRVNFRRKLSFRQNGTAANEVVAIGTIMMPAGLRLKPEDELTFEGTRYFILSCLPCYDCFGNENHVEVEIQ